MPWIRVSIMECRNHAKRKKLWPCTNVSLLCVVPLEFPGSCSLGHILAKCFTNRKRKQAIPIQYRVRPQSVFFCFVSSEYDPKLIIAKFPKRLRCIDFNWPNRHPVPLHHKILCLWKWNKKVCPSLTSKHQGTHQVKCRSRYLVKRVCTVLYSRPGNSILMK